MNDYFIVTFYVQPPGEEERPWVAFRQRYKDMSVITLGLLEMLRAKVDPDAEWYFVIT